MKLTIDNTVNDFLSKARNKTIMVRVAGGLEYYVKVRKVDFKKTLTSCTIVRSFAVPEPEAKNIIYVDQIF